MVEVPKITGADVLRAILRLTADLPRGAPFALSKFDGADLLKLTADELRTEFKLDPEAATETQRDLRSASLNPLSQAIGIKLIVDSRISNSVIPNAWIIRSAGSAADDEETFEETLQTLHKIRHG